MFAAAILMIFAYENFGEKGLRMSFTLISKRLY